MIKINITAYSNGTLTSHSQQRIRTALEAELRRGIHHRHPLFDILIKQSAEAAAKAVATRSQQHLHLHQTQRHLV